MKRNLEFKTLVTRGILRTEIINYSKTIYRNRHMFTISKVSTRIRCNCMYNCDIYHYKKV